MIKGIDNANEATKDGLVKVKSAGNLVKSSSGLSVNSVSTANSIGFESYAGYLQRKSRQHPSIWLKRFFKLEDGVLSYYHSAQSHTAAWQMSVHNISKIVKSSEGYNKFDFTLEVHGNEGTVLVLGSKDPSETMTWLSKINRVLNAIWNQNVKNAMQIAKLKASRSNPNIANSTGDSTESLGGTGAAAAQQQKLVVIKKSVSHKSDLAKSVSFVDFARMNQSKLSQSQVNLKLGSVSIDSLAQQAKPPALSQLASSSDRLVVLSRSDTSLSGLQQGNNANAAAAAVSAQSGRLKHSGSNLRTELTKGSSGNPQNALQQSRSESSDSIKRSKSGNILPPTLFDPISKMFIRPPPPPKLALLSSPVHQTAAADAFAIKTIVPSSLDQLRGMQTLVPAELDSMQQRHSENPSPPVVDIPPQPPSPDSPDTPRKQQSEAGPATTIPGFTAVRVEYSDGTTKEQLRGVMEDLQGMMEEMTNPQGQLSVLELQEQVEEWSLTPDVPQAAIPSATRDSTLEATFKIRRSVLVPEHPVETASNSRKRPDTLSRASLLQSNAFIYPTLLRLEHLVDDLVPYIEAECQCVLAAGVSKYQKEIFDRLTVAVFECTKLARCIFRDSVYHAMDKDEATAVKSQLDKHSSAYKSAYAVGKTARQLGITGAEYFNNAFLNPEPGSRTDLKRQELLVSLDDLVNGLRQKLQIAREHYKLSN